MNINDGFINCVLKAVVNILSWCPLACFFYVVKATGYRREYVVIELFDFSMSEGQTDSLQNPNKTVFYKLFV